MWKIGGIYMIKSVEYNMPYGLYEVKYISGKMKRYTEKTIPGTVKDFISENDSTRRTCNIFNTLWTNE